MLKFIIKFFEWLDAPTIEIGWVAGERCGRDGCTGVIENGKVEGCSCHIDPPCSACTSDWAFCPDCGWEAENKYRDFEWEAVGDPTPRPGHHKKPPDRRDEITSTYTANPFNSTPFTRCCGTAAINTDRCPSCQAQITFHDDGLSERRRQVGAGNCLMCGKRRSNQPLGTPGTCCC